MRLETIAGGAWLVVAVVDPRGHCPVKEALDTIERDDRTAHAELAALLSRIAQAGPPRDERRSRHLGAGVFELKTPQGFRIIYFFDRGRLIVCSELCRKPKPRDFSALIRRAQRFRAAYFAASAAGDIVIQRGA
jgi:putative component of toxin-antitoxin plasmid stabilization module